MFNIIPMEKIPQDVRTSEEMNEINIATTTKNRRPRAIHPPRAIRSKVKVKSFKTKWLEEAIDEISINRWATPDLTDPSKAICFVCDAKFNINEGVSSLRQHCRGLKHRELFAKHTSQ